MTASSKPCVRRLSLLGLSIACALFASMLDGPRANAEPWADIGRRDLAAINEIIRTNHPGPVDGQNGFFREWMARGTAEAGERMAAARNFRDYKRALLAYINGYRDGHLRLNLLVDAARSEWPGFLPSLSIDGIVRVGTSIIPTIREGERILSCDGLLLQQLFDNRVAPLWLNPDVPHQRFLQFPRTLLIDQGDQDSRLRECVVQGDGEPRTVRLEWRFLSPAEASAARLRAAGQSTPELGLRIVNDVWVLSMPSFNYFGSDSVSAFRSLRDQVEANLSAIRSGTLVIDVRGNLGGMSSWADDIIATLWSREWVTAIQSQFDNSVDWRASQANLAHAQELLARLEHDGLQEDAQHVRQTRDLIARALNERQYLARQSSPARNLPLPARSSDLPGRVFLLTDYRCVSACLDFSDMVLRLPGVVHIGQPTGADAIYIDNDETSLPSGLASLSYSMKVYLNRVRGHNRWHEPVHVWPGGAMTFENIAAWVNTLPRVP